MARIGGRSTWFAWTVGVISAVVIGALVWLAIPALPAGVAWFSSPSDSEANPTPTSGGVPVECRGLFSDALWASLRSADESKLTQGTEAPVISATAVVDSLQPEVVYTCSWTATDKSISTTVANVAADAGSIAMAALPAAGYTCSQVSADRIRCSFSSDVLIETIEISGGKWLSTSQSAWFPQRYADRVAEEVWRS